MGFLFNNAVIVAGGKEVDNIQDELKDLLFGEEDSNYETENKDYIGKPITKVNDNVTVAGRTIPRKVELQHQSLQQF